jgi:membrane associated rhomboid family serine protease
MAVRDQRNLHAMGAPNSGGGGAMFQRLKDSFRRLPRVVKGLIALEAGLYLLALVMGERGLAFLTQVSFVPAEVLNLELWRLVTYWPFHVARDPLGMIFDIVILWSLGSIFAHRWRPNHFLFFFVMGCIGAAGINLLLYLALPGSFGAPQLGASGGSFALFVAFYLIFGDSLVSVFGSQPMKGKWVFVAIAGLQLVLFISGVNPAFGIQLGGALTGWLLVTGRWRPRKLKAWLAKRQEEREQKRRAEEKSRFRVIH